MSSQQLSSDPVAVVIISRITDISILRPLTYLLSDEYKVNLIFATTAKFEDQIKTAQWWFNELEQMRADAGAQLLRRVDPYIIWTSLAGHHGIALFASESSVSAHVEALDILRSLPKQFISIGIQHGLECVGFYHSPQHSDTYGETIQMYSDIICSWFEGHQLKDYPISQNNRLFVTGPPFAIQNTQRRSLLEPVSAETDAGYKPVMLICENLHSVRFGTESIRRALADEFYQTILACSYRLMPLGLGISLRPHPAGRYSTREPRRFPQNVTIDNRPTYRINWKQYAVAISPPSTILVDFLYSGIPHAVWISNHSAYRGSNSYGSLAYVSSSYDVETFLHSHFPASVSYISSPIDPISRYSLLPTPQQVTNRFRSLFSNLLGSARSPL